jgi:hypothetical protein
VCSGAIARIRVEMRYTFPINDWIIQSQLNRFINQLVIQLNLQIICRIKAYITVQNTYVSFLVAIVNDTLVGASGSSLNLRAFAGLL